MGKTWDANDFPNIKVMMLKGERGTGVKEMQSALNKMGDSVAELERSVTTETARINNLIKTDTDTLNGTAIERQWTFAAPQTPTFTATFSGVPQGAYILQATYKKSGEDTVYSEGVSYAQTGTTVVVTIEGYTVSDPTANPATVYLAYAYAVDPDLSEVEDIRVKYDGTTALTAGAAVREQVGSILTNIAAVYSNARTYAVGDYCLYGMQLYKCISTIETAEEWNASKWEAVNFASSIGADVAEAKADAAAATTAASSALSNLALEYSASSTYAVGAYVLYDSVLYECTTAITTPEEWTAGHWTYVTAGRALKFLEAKSNANVNALNKTADYETAKWLDGRFDTLATGEATNFVRDMASLYMCAIFECEEGDVIAGNVSAGSSTQRAWAFYDSEGVSLGRSDNLIFGDFKVTAPANAAYIVINCFKNYADKWAIKGYKDIGNTVSKLVDAIGYEHINVLPSYAVGYYWNTENETAVKTAYANYVAYDPIHVEAGQEYNIVIYEPSSSKTHGVTVVTENYTILQRLTSHRNTITTFNVTVPDNGAYILLTTSSTTHAQDTQAYLVQLSSGTSELAGGLYDFENKNVAIIGDSISTNGPWSALNPLGNVPEIIIQTEDVGVELSAYATYYDIGVTVGEHTITEEEVGTEITFTPTSDDVGKIVGNPANKNSATVVTWWEVAAEVLGFNPIPVAWSGSSITSHEGESDRYKTSYSWHDAQIRKCGIRTPGTMNRTAPDMVIIYRGTNDLTHSPYSRITEYLDSYPTEYPESDTYDDNGTTRYDFVKGMRLLISKLRTAYPEVKIVLCTMNYFRRLSTTSKWTTNGTNTYQQYNETIRRLAAYEGCLLIDFAEDGLTWANAANDYYLEGTSSTAAWTHPNTRGHYIMGTKALRDLIAQTNAMS